MSENESPFKVRRKTYLVVKEPTDPPDETVIQGAAAAAAYLLPVFRAADAGREHFGAVFLNQRHRAIAAKILFSGGIGETPVFPREISRAALLLNAAAVIIAHSHPSRDLTPSREDEAVTRRVALALSAVETRLLDHLILSPDDGRFRSVGMD